MGDTGEQAGGTDGLQGGVLTSLRQIDLLRSLADVTRIKGTNVDILESFGEKVALCHLSTLIAFTEGDFVPYRAAFEDLAVIALAAHHLNVGDGSIVPEVEGLNERCNVRFSVEFGDTQYQGGVTLSQVVDQTSRDRNGPKPIPCAFMGAYRSSVSIPMSIVTGLLGYPQVSGSSTSVTLDDKSQYPLFGRTIPSDTGNAVPIIIYLRNVLEITRLAVINVNDAYGNLYVEGLRTAAAEFAQDMTIYQIPLDEGNIEATIASLKHTECRFVFAIVFTTETHDALMEEAVRQGVAGTGKHNWLFGDSFPGTLEGRSFEKGSPRALAYQGVGLLQVSGGVVGIPEFDNFVSAINKLRNPEDLQYLGTLMPDHYDHPSYGDEPPFINDETFLTSIESVTAVFFYEATIALGLSACNVSQTNLTFTGVDHYNAFRDTIFRGVSGEVVFDNTTGTRDPSSALYTVTNYVEKEEIDPSTGKSMVSFSTVDTDLFLDGEWVQQAKYVFNDGTSNLPVDYPPPVSDSVNLGVVVGVPVAVAIFLAVIIFLFYEHKRKENDSVWIVKKEELKFADPPEIIGRGTFGLVLLAEYRGTQVAVKRVIPPRNKRERRTKRMDSTGSCVDSSASGGYDSDTDGGTANMETNSNGSGSNSNLNVGMMSGSNHNVGMMSGSNHNVGMQSGSNHRVGMASGMSGQHSSYKTGTASSVGTSLGLRSRRLGGGTDSVVNRVNESAQWRKLKQDFMEEMRYLSKLRHPCVTTVMGAVIGKSDDPMLVLEYMDHGSLHDLLHNVSLALEPEVLLPILRDITQGVRFLHSAVPQVIHGDLKSQNILVDRKNRAKVADFGLSQKKNLGGTGTPFWMAPELLRGESTNTAASDVYSFGIILYEVYSRRDPYEGEKAEQVLKLVADKTVRKRPPVPLSMPPSIKTLMADCLEDDPDKRPSSEELDIRIKRVDAEMVEQGPSSTRNSTISLFDIFPRHIAEALRDGRTVEPEHRDSVTIFFSDIVGFTNISATLEPRKVADMLDRLYTKFDELSRKHDVFKVETIGDAYMAVTNLVKDQPDDHARRIAYFAIDAITAANGTLIDTEDEGKGFVNIRVGFHSGSVVADVVGTRNPRYCLFGDTVNTASRMESNSKVNRIHCSGPAADLLKKQCPKLPLKSRGLIPIKGKGEMHTYWVNETGRRSTIIRDVLSKQFIKQQEFAEMNSLAEDSGENLTNSFRNKKGRRPSTKKRGSFKPPEAAVASISKMSSSSEVLPDV